MHNSYALTEYRPQGLSHILKLGGIVTAGTVLVSMGGSLIFAAPLALATVYQLFRSAGRVQSSDWCESRDELWDYRLSPKHRSVGDDYEGWCEEWGRPTINSLVEQMVGNCFYANFTRDSKHPYHGLRGVLVFDCEGDGLPPLTPHDYISARLQQRMAALSRAKIEAYPLVSESITVPAVAVVEDMKQLPPQQSSESQPKELASLRFLLKLTQSALQPVIIVGAPGSGKGILSAIALRLGAKHNGLTYWVFNVKASLKEAGYWDGAQHHFLKDRLQSDEKLFTDLMAVLNRFGQEGSRRNGTQQDHPPMVLLLEEVNALTGLLDAKQRQEFKAKVTALASLLRGCNMAIWLSGQSVNLDDLGLTGKANRAMFTAIAAVGEDRAAVGAICEMLGIPYNPALLDSTQRYWLTSESAYLAPPAPRTIRQYSSWEEVPNIVELRPQKQRQTVAVKPVDSDLAAWESLQSWQGSLSEWEKATYGYSGGAATGKRLALQQRFGRQAS